MHIFQKQRFKMHSGGYSDFKLECDALSDKDIETLAFLTSRSIKFNQVIGIPRGGLKFAEALNQYKILESKTVLIADDVLTTGASLNEYKTKLLKDGQLEVNIQGIVIFSRGILPEYVTAIFNLNPHFWQND